VSWSINNSTNINKMNNHLSSQTCQIIVIEQPPLISNMSNHCHRVLNTKKTMTYGIPKTGPDLAAQKWGRVKPITSHFNAWERILKCLLNYNKIGQIIQANFVHWVILYRFGPRRYFLFFYLDFYEAKSRQDYSLGVDMKLLSSLVCWSTMFNGHICKQ